MAVIRKNGIQLNKKSSVPNKAPEPSQLQYGEIAINYAAGSEAIYIKNTNDSIVNVTAGSGGGGGGTVGTLTTTASTALSTQTSESLSNAVQLHKVSKTGSYNDLNNKPTIPSAPGTLTTTATTALATASNEALTGNIALHKVSKTGSYDDLNNKPTALSSFTEDATHRLVTDTEKSTWNSKGNGTITGINMNGASKGTSGVVNLGTVITAETQLSTGTTSGNGNAVTSINVSNHQISLVKDKTFTTSGDVKTQIESYNYLTGYTETDPTVPSWAKQTNKPTYTASEVGALPTGTTLDNIADGTNRKLSNYATTGTVNTLNNTVTAHTSNSDIHVTAAQKNTWNGKQDAISDLATIRNNASSGATAYTNVTAHTNNSNIHVTATQKTNWTSAYDNRITGVTFTSGNTNNATISGNKLNITGMTVPAYSASDSGKVLSINSSGQLVWITPVTIYTGTTAPDNSQGIDGDIYLQTS